MIFSSQVPAEKLRWAVGTIISEGDELPDQNLVDAFQSKGFYLFFLPAVTNAVRTSFPNRTSLSLLIAIFKVYPLLAEYVKVSHEYQTMKLHTLLSKGVSVYIFKPGVSHLISVKVVLLVLHQRAAPSLVTHLRILIMATRQWNF